MPTKRERELQITITPDENGLAPAPLEALNAVLWKWSPHARELLESEDQRGNKEWAVVLDGPFSAAEVRQLAQRLKRAMQEQGHAILLLLDPRFEDDSCRILRVEVLRHEIDVESGPEE